MKLRFLFSLALGASIAAAAQGYQDGVDNYNADRFDIAKEILNNTINDSSTDKAVAYYYLGNIAFLDKDVNAAKANFEKGMAANPEYPYNYIGLGEVALKSGDKGAAQKQFDQAMKINKKDTEVMAAVARAYWNVDPVAYAKDIQKYIDKALKDSKNTEPAVYMLQGDMAAKEDPGKAAGLYEMAITQATEKGEVNREAYVKYAHVYDTHNRPLVIQKLEELNELDPESGLAQRELAEVYYKNNQYGKAWKSYEKYVKNPNHFRRDEQRYAGLLHSAGEHAEAVKWADKILSEDPSVYYMHRLKMLSQHALENEVEAAKSGDALFSDPTRDFVPNDYIVYGEALVGADRAGDAVAVLENGIAKIGGDDAVTIYPTLSEAYKKTGNADKAIEVYGKYLQSGSATANDCYAMYQNYIAKAREQEKGSAAAADAYNEALKYINLAIEKAPNVYQYYYFKAAAIFARNGNTPDDECVAAVNKMFDILSAASPETLAGAKAVRTAGYQMLGMYYVKNHDNAKALESFQAALDLNPDNEQLQKQVESLKK